MSFVLFEYSLIIEFYDVHIVVDVIEGNHAKEGS